MFLSETSGQRVLPGPAARMLALNQSAKKVGWPGAIFSRPDCVRVRQFVWPFYLVCPQSLTLALELKSAALALFNSRKTSTQTVRGLTVRVSVLTAVVDLLTCDFTSNGSAMLCPKPLVRGMVFASHAPRTVQGVTPSHARSYTRASHHFPHRFRSLSRFSNANAYAKSR